MVLQAGEIFTIIGRCRTFLPIFLWTCPTSASKPSSKPGPCTSSASSRRGHASPDDVWYDQDRNEWVLLAQGAARLVFDDGREVDMKPGDWLEIPAHQKHRVAWTDPARETVWLAVHYP